MNPLDSNVIETGILRLVYEVKHDAEQGKYWWSIPGLLWDSEDEFGSSEAAVKDVEEKFDQ